MNRSNSGLNMESFSNSWNTAFPGAPPVSHLLKLRLAERWFRIHSLPDSKRYAENAEEYEILLSRQNEVATEVLGENSGVFIVSGEFDWDDQTEHAFQYDEALKEYAFSINSTIHLSHIDRNENDEDQTYTLAIGRTIWSTHQHDSLLVEVAKDRSRAFFVSFANNSIFAPYDGGADFIVKDEITRDYFKEKYRTYLSPRKDGY